MEPRESAVRRPVAESLRGHPSDEDPAAKLDFGPIQLKPARCYSVGKGDSDGTAYYDIMCMGIPAGRINAIDVNEEDER
jgi:hypothetical protein